MSKTISMYDVLVPPAIRAFENLGVILDKAAAYADAKKIDAAVLLHSRLYVDMFPLVRQIQIATDMVKGGAARLAGQEPPSWADEEKTIDEVKARLTKVIAYLKSFEAAQLDGSESREIALKTRAGELHFTGQDYLLAFVLPNLYFHLTTTYNILRHNGVEIGKNDFLGRR